MVGADGGGNVHGSADGILNEHVRGVSPGIRLIPFTKPNSSLEGPAVRRNVIVVDGMH